MKNKTTSFVKCVTYLVFGLWLISIEVLCVQSDRVISFGSATKEDIIIEAQTQVKYYKKEDMCMALGNVRIRKGSLLLTAARAKLYFRTQAGKRQPYALEAIEDVCLIHPSGTLYGAHLWYWFQNQNTRVTGPIVRLVTERWSMWAKDGLTYSHGRHEILTQGPCHLIREHDHVTAHRGRILLTEQNQELRLHKVICQGRVHLWKNQQHAFADRGTYDANRRCGILRDNVILKNGSDVAVGSYGIFDFTSQKATLKGGPTWLMFTPNSFKKDSL